MCLVYEIGDPINIITKSIMSFSKTKIKNPGNLAQAKEYKIIIFEMV